MNNKKLGWDEMAVYYSLNVLTLGTLWVIKIIIKKAIIESK